MSVGLTVQSVIRFSHKHEDLSSIPPKARLKSQGGGVCLQKRWRQADTQGSLASKPIKSVNSRPRRDAVAKLIADST